MLSARLQSKEGLLWCVHSLVSVTSAVAEKQGVRGSPWKALAAGGGTWVLTVTVTLICAARLKPGQGWLPGTAYAFTCGAAVPAMPSIRLPVFS